ncbi:polysaccharide deacetylase family protein [Halalkalibacter urbisdiaboli]|uniref:polysaccharide deacetylase family protein n=1 Tax=Halalkalibacter urbisdiaboli TaxID=1960589 RepID=UPI000B42F0DB|nr:polysaccharide deacetylase family protein [Halalkalibacter urbisdiaboli]
MTQTPANKREVVLTFDDGPSRYLPEILDILLDEKVPAHFFWQTRLLHHKRPWQRVLEEGHRIGTHSHRHRNLKNASFETQYQDISKSKQLIERLTNTEVCWFRPPFGQYNEHTLEVCKQLNLIPVLWSVHSFDWENESQSNDIIRHVLKQLHDGAIILLHERKVTVDALSSLIKQMKEKGYQFKTLS